MNANTSPLHPSPDGRYAAAQGAPELSPAGRYCARMLAVLAYLPAVRAGRPAEAEEKIRGLFLGLEERGYGFPPECEAAVLSELAALRAS